jgi:hypothetical protein
MASVRDAASGTENLSRSARKTKHSWSTMPPSLACVRKDESEPAAVPVEAKQRNDQHDEGSLENMKVWTPDDHRHGRLGVKGFLRNGRDHW